MKHGLKIQETDYTLVHAEKPDTGTLTKEYYDELVVKGPTTINFSVSGDVELIKVIYNFDYSKQCGVTTQPVSGEKVIEPVQQELSDILIDPAEITFQATFFPDRYQYKATYFPGLTTIDRDFNTVVHNLSVTVAQPSMNEFVGDINLLDVRTFTNIAGVEDKSILVVEDVKNQWVVPVTLFGERTYTSSIELGDTILGNIKFNLCLTRAPYDNVKPDGTEIALTSDVFDANTIFMGSTKYGTYDEDGYPGAVRDEFSLKNTGAYTLEVLSATAPLAPFFMDVEKLLGEYSPADSGCENEKSAYVYFFPPNIVADAEAAGENFSAT